MSDFLEKGQFSVNNYDSVDTMNITLNGKEYIDNTLAKTILGEGVTFANNDVKECITQLYDNVGNYMVPNKFINLGLTDRHLRGYYVFNVYTQKSSVSSLYRDWLFPTRSGNNLIISDDSSLSITLPQVDFQRLFPNAYNYGNISGTKYYCIQIRKDFNIYNNTIISENGKYLLKDCETSFYILDTLGGSINVQDNDLVTEDFVEMYLEFELIDNKTLQASKAYLRNDSFTSNVDLFPILKDEFGEGGIFYYGDVADTEANVADATKSLLKIETLSGVALNTTF